MKKLILFIALMLCLTSFTHAGDQWGKYLQQRGAYFWLYDSDYFQDLGVSFTFTYTMADAHSDFRPNRDEDFFKSVYDDRFTYNYYFGTYEDDATRTKLPYSIHDCWVKCDAEEGLADFYTEFSNNPKPPYTDTYYHNAHYTCFYDDSYENKDITIEVGCKLVRSNYWANTNVQYFYNTSNEWEYHPHPQYDMGFDTDQIISKCESANQCYEFRGSTYCDMDSRYSSDWGVDWKTCNEVLIDVYRFNVTIPTDGGTISKGGSTDDPDEPYDGGDTGGDLDGNIDDEEEDKQASFDYEIGIAKKKGIIINNLIFMMELTFSFILLFFYILEIAFTIFVFTVWIPSIFRALVDILRKIGGVN